MKPYGRLLFATLLLFLSACGSQDPPVTLIAPISNSTSTPDPCSTENLAGSIKEVNDLRREFEDASQLASNLAREQLPNSISDMQRIRRAPEDDQVPACMSELKTHQLAHMNIVIDTMIFFAGGAHTGTLSTGGSPMRVRSTIYTRLKLRGCWE